MVVERGERELASLVSNQRDPWPQRSCGREQCFPCKSTRPEGTSPACWRSSIAYKINCIECEDNNIIANYIGESGKSGYSRGRQHWDGIERRDPSNVLQEHAALCHGGSHHYLKPDNFNMKVLGSYQSSLGCQIWEGVLISNEVEERDKVKKKWREKTENSSECRIVLNSTRQWSQPGLIKQKPCKLFY